MATPNFSSVNVDDEIPSLNMPPMTRHALAIYCGASGDHNPLHVDSDFAKEAGLDDVIAHGMLIMAYMGRTLTGWVQQDAIRSFDTRFQAMTCIGDAITTSGKIVEKFTDEGESCVRVEIAAADQTGEVKAVGNAVVALS
jgi:acyl dehydratase